MDDTEIIALFFARSEDAISRTAQKYGDYCRAIAGSILRSREDCDECLQDVWYRAWESIPPSKPQSLRAYLGCLTRNLAISRWRRERSKKRGGREFLLSLEELGDCVPAQDDPAAVLDRLALTQALRRFLAAQRETDRRIFLQRYWYFRSVREIAQSLGLTESSVKISLYRGRKALRRLLEQEGIV